MSGIRTGATISTSSSGAPVDASKLSRAEIARLWNLPNPQADPMQVQQLIAAGQHRQAVDLMYPWRMKLIGQGDPERTVQRAQQFASMSQPEVVST